MAYAIQTKFVRPTATHGARISASCVGHGKASYPYPHELTDLAAREAVAKQFATESGLPTDAFRSAWLDDSVAVHIWSTTV